MAWKLIKKKKNNEQKNTVVKSVRLLMRFITWKIIKFYTSCNVITIIIFTLSLFGNGWRELFANIISLPVCKQIKIYRTAFFFQFILLSSLFLYVTIFGSTFFVCVMSACFACRLNAVAYTRWRKMAIVAMH